MTIPASVNKPFILVYSQNDFWELCQTNGWTDDTVEGLKDEIAFISICGTKDARDSYLDDSRDHYFQAPHPNVLNQDFDDVSRDFLYKGIMFKVMTPEQAKEMHEFIKKNLGKSFIIHCMAGMSRSQAVCRFLLDCYFDTYKEEGIRKDNPPLMPNYEVLRLLKEDFSTDHPN